MRRTLHDPWAMLDRLASRASRLCSEGDGAPGIGGGARFLPPSRSFGTITQDLERVRGGSPTATEAEGMEFVLSSATLNDPIAMLGYAPGVYQHGAPTIRPGVLGEHWPDRQLIRIDPALYGDPSFAGVGRHEFRHRGLEELRSLAARAPAGSFMLPTDARAYEAFFPRMMREGDTNEDFNRLLDIQTGNVSIMTPGSHDYLGAPTGYGRDMARGATQQAERILSDVTNQYVLDEGRRWGDW